MAVVKDTMKNLEHMHAFLRQQEQCMEADVFNAARQAQAMAIVNVIKGIQMDPADAVQLSEAVSAGPWTAEQLRAMSSAIAASIVVEGSIPGTTKNTTANQDIKFLRFVCVV